MTQQLTTARHNTGFSLLEVLIALLVLSIGLLGLAGMQSYGLQSNHQSYLRSQAMLIAYDMADRMRANSIGVTAGGYNNIDSTAAQTNQNCSTATCTPAQLATYDAYDWVTNYVNNAKLLPGGSATVVKNPADPNTFIIAITWNERTGSAISGQSTAAASTPKTITVVFRPL